MAHAAANALTGGGDDDDAVEEYVGPTVELKSAVKKGGYTALGYDDDAFDVEEEKAPVTP